MALDPTAFAALVYLTLATLVAVFAYEVYALVIEQGGRDN